MIRGPRVDQSVTDWLLTSPSPSVRYLAMTGLEGRNEKDPNVAEAKADIMLNGPVPKILSKQDEDGHWGRPEDFYNRSKYKGTVWSFIVLAELGADGSSEPVRKAMDFLLRWSMEPSGGFAYVGSENGGDPACIIPCLQGNLVWAMLRFGSGEDPRVARSVEWIARWQRFDDAEGPAPKGWPYGASNCWGRHTCHMGAVKALKALSAIPEGSRSNEVRSVIELGAEHLLKHRLFKSSHDPNRIAKEEWTKLGYPRIWYTDALEMLEVLTDLGYRDDRMEDAVELVVGKMRPDGTWVNERSFNGRMWTVIEKDDEPGPWVTLKAMMVLRRLGRLD